MNEWWMKCGLSVPIWSVTADRICTLTWTPLQQNGIIEDVRTALRRSSPRRDFSLFQPISPCPPPPSFLAPEKNADIFGIVLGQEGRQRRILKPNRMLLKGFMGNDKTSLIYRGPKQQTENGWLIDWTAYNYLPAGSAGVKA